MPAPHPVGGGGAPDTAQAQRLFVSGLPPVGSATVAADDAGEAGRREDGGGDSDGHQCPSGPWGGHRDGPEMPLWTALPPTQPGQPQAPPGSHNSQGILATRSGMSPDSAVVPTGAGVLWGPGGCPISTPCWLGGDGQGGRVTCGDGPSGPCPPPHLPAASLVCLGKEAAGVTGGTVEWSQGEGGSGLWPKHWLSCHRPGLLATSPTPSPGREGWASPGLPTDPSHRRLSSCRNPSIPRGCCLRTPLSPHFPSLHVTQEELIHTREPALGHPRAW